jgi:dTDP-4-dehydrorhamnose reductase
MNDRNPLRFLVIGAGGLVGQHLRAALAGRDAVFTYRRDAPPDAVALDIMDKAAISNVLGHVAPDVIVLAAANAYVEQCEREPEATWRVNVGAASGIAEMARSSGALMVVFSSEYVFDGTAGDYGEGDERRPLNAYGRQKVALEDIALEGHGLVCRTSAVFGNDPRRKNFVCQLVDHLSTGKRFDVPSDQLITPTYAPSLASSVIDLVDRGLTGVFHVAGPAVLKRTEFAQAAANAYGLDVQLLMARSTSELGLAARRPLRCGLRTDKLTAALGKPLTPHNIALRELAMTERLTRR